MSCQKGDSSWTFINFTRFDTYKTVLNVVDTSDAMLTSNNIHFLDKVSQFHFFTVKSNWFPFFKGYIDIFSFIWRRLWWIGNPKSFFWSLIPRIFKNTTLVSTSPKVLIDWVRIIKVCWNWNTISLSILNFFLTRPFPFTHWRHYFKTWV